jgi:hypothetical protein
MMTLFLASVFTVEYKKHRLEFFGLLGSFSSLSSPLLQLRL